MDQSEVLRVSSIEDVHETVAARGRQQRQRTSAVGRGEGAEVELKDLAVVGGDGEERGEGGEGDDVDVSAGVTHCELRSVG